MSTYFLFEKIKMLMPLFFYLIPSAYSPVCLKSRNRKNLLHKNIW